LRRSAISARRPSNGFDMQSRTNWTTLKQTELLRRELLSAQPSIHSSLNSLSGGEVDATATGNGRHDYSAKWMYPLHGGWRQRSSVSTTARIRKRYWEWPKACWSSTEADSSPVTVAMLRLTGALLGSVLNRSARYARMPPSLCRRPSIHTPLTPGASRVLLDSAGAAAPSAVWLLIPVDGDRQNGKTQSPKPGYRRLECRRPSHPPNLPAAVVDKPLL
jgi:hypothetical protein